MAAFRVVRALQSGLTGQEKSDVIEYLKSCPRVIETTGRENASHPALIARRRYSCTGFVSSETRDQLSDEETIWIIEVLRMLCCE
jgi:hypothetical protein